MLAFRWHDDAARATVETGAFVRELSPIGANPARRHVLQLPSPNRPSSTALTVRPAAWLGSAAEQLARIAALQEDWDSYGAPPISRARIVAACDLIQAVADDRAPAPTLVPTPEGSIQLEWHSHGIELEVLMLSDTEMEVSFEDLLGELPEYEEVLSFDLTLLSKYVRLLGERAQEGRDG